MPQSRFKDADSKILTKKFVKTTDFTNRSADEATDVSYSYALTFANYGGIFLLVL